jgi:hypothetical protein
VELAKLKGFFIFLFFSSLSDFGPAQMALAGVLHTYHCAWSFPVHQIYQ